MQSMTRTKQPWTDFVNDGVLTAPEAVAGKNGAHT